MRHFGKVVAAAVVVAQFAVLAPGQAAAGSDEGWITTWSSITSSSSRKYGVKLSIGRGGPWVSLITPKPLTGQEGRIADLLSKGEYDEAIAALDAAIRLDPQNAVPYVNRGFAWAMKGDLDKAIADFDEAIRLNPKEDAAYSNRGNAWQGKGELDKAIADYDKAITLEPNYGAFYNNRGSAWLATGEFDKAIADCNDAMRLDPRMDHIHYYNRAQAWREKWELDKAIADYTEALRLEPTAVRTYVARCHAWRLKGDLVKAVADADEATRLDPHIKIAYDPRHDHPEAYEVTARGLAEFDVAAGLGLRSAVADIGPGSGEKSKRDPHLVPASAGAADQPDPRLAEKYVERGISRNAKGEFAQAIAEFLEALRLDPRCASAYLNRGIAWKSVGDYSRALADFDEAIRLNPELAGAHRNRGVAWEEKGEYARAETEFDEALRLDPNDFQAINSLAWLRATCPDASHRDGTKAVALATRACERTSWIEWGLISTLAAACAEAGDFDAAVKWQERVVALIGDGGARALEDGQDLENVRARVGLYRARKPYREEPKAK